MRNAALRPQCFIDCSPDSRIPIRSSGAPPRHDLPFQADNRPHRQANSSADDVMALYLCEISRIPLLTADDETELARQCARVHQVERRLSRPRGGRHSLRPHTRARAEPQALAKLRQPSRSRRLRDYLT